MSCQSPTIWADSSVHHVYELSKTQLVSSFVEARSPQVDRYVARQESAKSTIRQGLASTPGAYVRFSLSTAGPAGAMARSELLSSALKTGSAAGGQDINTRVN